MEKLRSTTKRLFTSVRESETYRNPSASTGAIQTECVSVESLKRPEETEDVWKPDSLSSLALCPRIHKVVDGVKFTDFDVGNENYEASSGNGKLNDHRRKERSSCRKRRLLRSFTLSSIPATLERTSKMFQLAKAPLKVKFLVSPKGAAWFLEEDIERSSLGCNDTRTDSTPFGYNTSQTYYSSAPCSPNSFDMTRKKKAGLSSNPDMAPRPSISLENLNRLRVSPSKLTLNEPDPNESNEVDNEGSTALRRSYSFTQRNFRRNAVIEPPSEGVSGKTKRKRDLVLEVFFKSVERQDEEQVKKLLEINDVDINELNEDGFTALDVSLMLHAEVITGHLLEHEARGSDRFSAALMEEHITMLRARADEQVQQFVSDVVHRGSTDAKDSERQLKECEWRLHILESLLKGFKEIELPASPSNVFLSAASETSLLVRFSGPASGKVNPVTRYRVQWSRDEAFDNLDGEHYSHNILHRQYTIVELQKSIAYYVRVCVGNIKGYGTWMASSPPCVVPSSWHELDDSKPRFQGKLDRIAKLFQEVQTHEMDNRLARSGNGSKSFRLRRSPQLVRKRASSWHVSAGNEVTHDRKDSKKRSFTKYAKLFTSTPKFVKELKRGIYLSTLFYTKDDKVLVTLDENLPVVEVDDSSTNSLAQEFQWLLKVGCTWHDVRLLKEQVERNLSSTSVFLRAQFLQALDTLQTGVGCDDLGQLHYRIIKDKNGTNIIVITKRIKYPSFIKSRTLSMKWFSLSKLQRKMAQKDSQDSQNATSQLVTSIQECISYQQQTKKPLDRGLYLGFLKLRTSLDAIHVTVPRYSPNILPHVKVRDNPHVSREEWEWLTGLTTVAEEEEEVGAESSPNFHSILENAIKNLLDDIGMSRKDCSNCRIYDREVVELSNDVSLLILVPSPELVCSCPGDGDIFSDNEKFISIPVTAFEMNLMRTYQNQFICHYSRLSSILEMASLINQQESRKAIVESEISNAREGEEKLNTFQKELDVTWKGMRWLLDAMHYARDREIVIGIPLDLVFDTRRPSSPEPYDSHRKHTERKVAIGNGNSTENGVLKIYSACETGLAPGKCVKLHVSPYTTVQQVVQLVVRQFEKLVQQTNPITKSISEEKLKEFCLVAVIGGNERCLKDDYKILQLQNPWTKGKLYIRLRVEAVAAENSSPSTSV